MIWTWRGARAPRSSCTPSLEPHGAATRQCCSVTLWGRRRGGGGSPCHCTAVGGPEIRGAASSCREKRGPFGFPLSSPCRGPADIALGGGLRCWRQRGWGCYGWVFVLQGPSCSTGAAPRGCRRRGDIDTNCWCNGDVYAAGSFAQTGQRGLLVQWKRRCSGAAGAHLGPPVQWGCLLQRPFGLQQRRSCSGAVGAEGLFEQQGWWCNGDGRAIGMVVQCWCDGGLRAAEQSVLWGRLRCTTLVQRGCLCNGAVCTVSMVGSVLALQPGWQSHIALLCPSPPWCTQQCRALQ